MERESVSSHINYETLQQNFHLPISQVAKELGVCATVLKKLCRQHGIPRWPHRKIKSLNKMISVLETTKSETEEEEQQRIIELKALLKKKEDIMDNPSIIGPTYSHISPRCGGTKPLGSNINKFAHSSTKTMSSSVNYNTFSPSQLPIQTQIHTHLQNQMQNQQAQITQSYLSQSASSIPKLQQQQQHSLNYAQTQGNLSTSLRTSEGNIHEQSVRALLQQKLSCISHSALQSSTSPCRRSPDIVHSAMLPYTSNFRTTPRSRTMSSPQILDNNMSVARPRFNYVPNASANSGELTDSNGNQTNGFSVPNSTNPFSFSRSSAFSQPDPALMSMISPMTMTAIAPVYSSSDLTSGGFIHFPSGNPARASSVPPQFLIPSLNPNNNNNNNNNSNNNNNTNNNNINIDTTSNNLGDSNGNLSSSNNNANNNNNVANLNDSEGSIRTTDGNSTNMHSAGMNYTLNIPGSRLASSHQENTDYSENNTTTTINSTNGTNVIRTLNNGSVGNNSNNDGNSSNNNHHHHQPHHHQLSNMNGNEAHYVPYPSKLPDLCGLEEKNATVGTIGNGGVEDDEDDYYYESTTSNTPPHTIYSYGLDPVSHH